MTAAGIRAARSKLGLTQAGLAALLRSDLRTVQRWESGERGIPGPAAVALDALADGWRPAT
jgi:DNA-binding transcriptional regulator YiaG